MNAHIIKLVTRMFGAVCTSKIIHHDYDDDYDSKKLQAIDLVSHSG